jgi:cysteine desulfurase
MPQIYLDCNASTSVHPAVTEALISHFKTHSANPSSVHGWGREAKKALVQAQDAIASFFAVSPDELYFTSSGTEAMNLAIFGAVAGKRPGRIISTKCEHAAVIEPLLELEKRGWQIDWIAVGPYGAATKEAVEQAIQEETALITLMGANNETGVKTDLAAIGKVAQVHGIPFIVDGVALLGKEEIQIPKGVSAMAFSGQKVYAPKGIGLLIARRSFKFSPQILGGGQQRGKRSGTENLPGIIALKEALQVVVHEGQQAWVRMGMLRDLLEQTILSALPFVTVNGEGPRVCNTTNLCFHGVDGETLFILLDEAGVMCSHGSACATGALEPSRALIEMGLGHEQAASSLRFSLGYQTTLQEVQTASDRVIQVVTKLIPSS